jgi:uncharacterized protein (TIGR00251 family)
MEKHEILIANIISRLAAKETVTMKVKISAGGGKNEVTGLLGEDTLKIRISAAPEKGKANKELTAFLSDTLGVSRGRIRIVSGQTSPLKTIEITPV